MPHISLIYTCISVVTLFQCYQQPSEVSLCFYMGTIENEVSQEAPGPLESSTFTNITLTGINIDFEVKAN